MDKYFEKYSGVRRYMDDIVRKAREEGYVTTLMGRRRWLPELKSANFNIRSFGERVALNMPIQGTAADVIKLAMLRVWRRMKAEGLAAKLVLQVHDELIVECPEQEAGEVKSLLAEEMQGVMDLSVPLVAEAGAGRAGRKPTERRCLFVTFQLVPMNSSHLAAVAAIERACFSSPWSEEMLSEELRNRHARYLVAEGERGIVLGYAGLQAVLDEGYITNIAVSPQFRRRGVADALVSDFCRLEGKTGFPDPGGARIQRERDRVI
jgi:DNA polymerase-1